MRHVLHPGPVRWWEPGGGSDALWLVESPKGSFFSVWQCLIWCVSVEMCPKYGFYLVLCFPLIGVDRFLAGITEELR